MKQKILDKGMDFLVLFMNHCIVSAIAIIVLGLCGFESPYVYIWFGLWLVPVYFYVIRSYVNKFYLFFIMQFVPLAAVCFLPIRLGLKIAIIVMTIFYTLSSIKQKLTAGAEETAFIPVFSIGVLGGAYIIDDMMSFRGWHSYYVLFFYLYIVCYVTYYFLNQYSYFIVVNKNSAGNIPEKQIFRSGIKQMGVYIAGGLGFLVLSSNIEWLRYILNILKNILGVIIRFLTSFMKEGGSEEQIDYGPMSGGNDGMGLMEPGEASIFWIVLEKIMTVALLAATVYLVVFGMIKGYRYLRKNFQKGRKKKDEAVYEGQDVREKCDVEVRTKNEFKLFAFLDNKEKIRKNYRKRMLKHKVSLVGDSSAETLEYYTAKECCEKLSAVNLQKAYEKARYSNETISAEDVKASKSEG